MRKSERGFPWGLTVASAVLFAVLMGLGVWQMQRLQWKTRLIAEAEAAAALPPAPLDSPGALAEFRKLRLSCPGLTSAAYLELQSIDAEGQPGVRLISACRPDPQGPTYLVDRGFVAETISSRPAERFSTTPTEIVAEVRRTPEPNAMAPAPSGRHFYARDNRAMAETLRVSGPVSTLTLFALTSSNPEWAALRPSSPPAAFTNNHLGYAITWFGLALVLVGFYIALLRRKSSPQAASLRERGDRAKDSS